MLRLGGARGMALEGARRPDRDRHLGTRTAKKPTQQGGYVETKQPTYPRKGRCVGRCVEPA